MNGPGSNPGGGAIFRTRPDRPWGPPSLLYNGTGSFPGVKRPGRGADHPPPSSSEVTKGYSYTSIHPLGQFRPVTGVFYLYLESLCSYIYYVTGTSHETYITSKMTHPTAE
jgi:hypothetical protein